MTYSLYPIMLRLDGRTCVVVGGGKVAARKVRGLLDANARVVVISREFCPELQALADESRIEARVKTFECGDLAPFDPLLVFAATDDPQVNREVAEEGRSLGALVNTADDGASGDFHNAAVARRGGITVTVSTGGSAPALAKQLAERLADSLTDDIRSAETRGRT
jgi:precorrin-2 dehydrogenase/sirohydrochlorin ferrochelatase